MGKTANPAKEALLAQIAASWTRINQALDRLSPAERDGRPDAQGWTVTDHVHHLVAWERSIVAFLQGHSRHTGLDVAQELFRQGDFDAINEVIYQRTRYLSWEDARQSWRQVHQEHLDLLAPLHDADLERLYRHYVPAGAAAADDERTAAAVILGNSAAHYDEHLAWIESLVAAAPD